MEKTPKPSNNIEKPRNRALPWVKRIIGVGILAGGVIVGGDQAWDSYQETQRHKEREDDKKRNIEVVEQTLKDNTKNLDPLNGKLDFDTEDNTVTPTIDKFVDSLKGLLKDLETQKENGTVNYETLVKIQSLTQHIEISLDSTEQTSRLLSALKSIDSGVEVLSKAELSKELSGYMDDFLKVLNDKDVLGAVSGHPRAVERILESIEDYKNTFADYYVNPKIYERDFEVMYNIDSLYQTELSEHERLFHTLMSLYKDGSLNDFFESLGAKVNIALTAARFDGKISLNKNFLESAHVECEKWIDETPAFENRIEKSMSNPPTRQELVDAFLTEMIYYEGYEFYSLFSADNSEAIDDLISEIEMADNLPQAQKEKVINAIKDLGKKISEFIIKLERSEKGSHAFAE